MKKFFVILFVLGLVNSAFSQMYDFSAVCETGQTLYYRILPNGNHEVKVTHPYNNTTNPWYGYTEPEGELIVPETVENNGIIYTVVIVGSNAFDACQNLTSVVLPNSIRRIEEEAFWYCTGISTEFIIPDQCTFIGGYAFMGCSAMSALTIGADVDTIQFSAFEDCVGLQSIHCNTPVPPFSEHIPSNPYYEDRSIFNNVPTDIPVYVNCLTFDLFQLNWDWSRFVNMEGVFIGAPELTVTVNNPDFGTAEVISVPEDCDNLTATVRAIPNLGHVFGYWKRNGTIVSFTPEYTFTLDHNCIMTACFDCAATIYDSIGYPDHVIGRTMNASGQATMEYPSDFIYNQNGVMNQFSFPGMQVSNISFDEYPTRPSSIYTYLGGHPASIESLCFTYEADHQISHSEHYRGNDYYDEINNHYDYYYSNHRLCQKDSKSFEDGEWMLWRRDRYAYENGNKTQIDSAFTGSYNNIRLSTVTTNIYDDAHRLQNVLTVSFDASGEITSRTKKIYTYTANNKTDSIITQTLNDGEWVNSGIAHYGYDFKNRVVEYQTGSWSAENAEWNITKKILYVFNDETQKVTISFRKKTGDAWGWDEFSGQSLFNDAQLYEWQRQLNSYSGLVNQFEITMHYNTVEQSFPILSEWYYEITGDDGSITYQHLEYMADTTINNDKTKVIVRTNQIYDKDGQTEVTNEYLKEHENKVYWWNKELQAFTVLYDYAAEAGDEWEINVGEESIVVHVDSVGIFDYQGDQRKVLHISDVGHVFDGDIVVGFGHLTSFFPERLMVKDHYEVDGLRCYWVGDALLYHHGDEDCDYIYSVIHEVDETTQDDVMIYPNPTDGVLFVVGTHRMRPYRITNLLGQTMMSGLLTDATIDVFALPSGMYFINVGNQTLKFIKR